jgi:hypothetical protein
LKETARGTVAAAFASHENKQENSGFNARASRILPQLSRQQGRAAIEYPAFAGAGQGFVEEKAGLVELSH